MSDMPQEVQDAYEQAGRAQPRKYKPLPDWETLSVELREAFVYVHNQGRIRRVQEGRGRD